MAAALVFWRRAARRSRRPLHHDEKGILNEAFHAAGKNQVFSRHGQPEHGRAELTVVLVHGFGVSGTYFIPLAQCLARHHTVYIPDLPGHGNSNTPAQPLDVDGLAQALLDWMDAARIENAALVGHSMGAQIAIAAVTKSPLRFNGLVLIGPTRDPRTGLLGQGWRLLRVAPYVRWSLYGILVRDYLRMGLRLLPECLAMMRDPLVNRLHRLYFSQSQRQPPLPVMLIKGGHDAIVPAYWFDYLKHLTRAQEAVVIPEAGHAVHYGYPSAVASSIEAFLLSQQPRCAATAGKSKNDKAAFTEKGRPSPPPT